ncbi:hypothetical protein SJA_C1-04800 [Sphingobium indicum UT26S]|uniref:Uncharacterized protein n=1 Tax=Sphingobium indicum (strain DSM 16413 / CCM 7287 / MTCC 6362 / UT26 / NBRC 101211 / UT26S) TaxID=452662 RepID=D4YY82_SPHIU|nr:hypothetical protein SJA_C1-04800 [Sphingobium indicum UT26S]
MARQNGEGQRNCEGSATPLTPMPRSLRLIAGSLLRTMHASCPRRPRRDRAIATLPSHRRPAAGYWRPAGEGGGLALDGCAIGRPG